MPFIPYIRESARKHSRKPLCVIKNMVGFMKNKNIVLTLIFVLSFLLTIISCNQSPEKSEITQDEIGELKNFMTDKMDTSDFGDLVVKESGHSVDSVSVELEPSK